MTSKQKRFIAIHIVAFLSFLTIVKGQDIPLDTMIKHSQYIIEGKVISSTPFITKDSDLYTSNIVQVNKIFKGNLRCGNVEITTLQSASINIHLKGNLNWVGSQVSDPIPALNKGNIGVFFCINTSFPSDTAPKENPKNIQLIEMPLIYNFSSLDTISLKKEHALIKAKIGHGYSSCAVPNEPMDPGSAEVMPSNQDGYPLLNKKTNNDILTAPNQIIKNIEVYPNPVSGTINIKLPDSEIEIIIEIYDDSGKAVFKKENISATELQNLDVAHLKPGNYTGIATSSMNTYHFKFTKL